MAVLTTDNRVQYNCDGSQTEFAFTFAILQTSALSVIITDADGTETTLAESSEYTVAPAGNDYSGGGTVTTVETYPSGYTITIIRTVSLDQQVDFRTSDVLSAEVMESSLDKLTMMVQQLSEQIDRALKLQTTSSYTDLIVPDPEANKALAWDSSLSRLKNVSIYGAGTLSVSSFVETLLDDADASEFLTHLGFSTFIKTLIDDTDAATARATLEAQKLDATLTALAGLATAADKLAYFTGTDTAALTTLTSFMRNLLDDTDATTARSTLDVSQHFEVIDDDGDTSIDVEETADVDEIVAKVAGVEAQRIHDNGILSFPKHSFVRAYKISDQTLTNANTWYTVTMTDDIDNQGEWDGPNNKFVAKEDGTYLVYFKCRFYVVADQDILQIAIYNLSTTTYVAIDRSQAGGSALQDLQVTGLISLDANDEIEFRAENVSSAGDSIKGGNAYNTYAIIVKIA